MEKPGASGSLLGGNQQVVIGGILSSTMLTLLVLPLLYRLIHRNDPSEGDVQQNPEDGASSSGEVAIA